eukprot:CAMPEP_0183353274 /NCGR_PEP_ID=MMETSP0164_2-20130417/33159_1 /TAXON_ID=221442 /ORGANISM="Coccolithus pelagicus ssp braarudi, Strain PLY182g" /LENGTH=578 /DNA_ID=CAMNT_0025525927 /DNA_START=21 /DNA_END=1756 /DNA_ORIENTATION=-
MKERLNRTIKRGDAKTGLAKKRVAQAEMLLPTEAGVLEAEGMERTDRFTQQRIAAEVDLQTQQKAYDVKLDQLGPYRAAFTSNGRRLLLGGKKGHIAIARWDGFHILQELQLKETVRDLTFLRDETMYAVAQHKNLYIYDTRGVELHCLRNHRPQVNRIQFLHYHWLLATVGSTGVLRYLDVSTGANVSEMPTRLGSCDCMRANPWSGVMHLGHANGNVTLWSPNMHEPLVKMLCHKGAVTEIAINRSGSYMATAGQDGSLKVWDVRMYRPLHSYSTPRPVHSLDISDRGMIAAAHGGHVQIYKDGLSSRAHRPYMAHRLPGAEVECLRFCPFEDVLGIGHSKGYSSMLVPGAGEPNFDAFEANPFQTRMQRRESEVVSLLEKLPAETIVLDPAAINTVDRSQGERKREMASERAARIAEIKANKKAKKKTRGRSKASKLAIKKESNILDEKREKHREQLNRMRAEAKAKRDRKKGVAPAKAEWSALDRFKRPQAQPSAAMKSTAPPPESVEAHTCLASRLGFVRGKSSTRAEASLPIPRSAEKKVQCDQDGRRRFASRPITPHICSRCDEPPWSLQQ